MHSGIEVLVLGDYGPFSEQGKSIGYQLFVNGHSYLIDLGAPPFQQAGGTDIDQIDGVFITHCHDDHKRWFTDVALYYMYTPALRRRLKLITTDKVARDVRRSAGPALDQSLDAESKRLVDIAFDAYVEHVPVGPRARYRICAEDGLAEGQRRWYVADSEGRHVGPERAKIVLSQKTGKPRLLFRDPDSGEWVEPETYYPFSSPVFYEPDQRPLDGDGYRISIINAPVWHGLPNFGLVVEAGGETLIFSSDTMHNLPLWQGLYQDKRKPAHDLTSREFLDAGVLVGDINDYIERTWSQARYEEAVKTFEGAAVIHDVTGRYGVVHTEYHGLGETALDPQRTLLTHSPDSFTVVGWQLMRAGKRYRVRDRRFLEVGPSGEEWPIDADVYHKFSGRFFAGHRHPQGRFHVYEKKQYHSVSDGPNPEQGELLFRANLFEDVNGYYLPHQNVADQFYLTRPDGRTELVLRDGNGSQGILVDDLRARRHAISPEELATLAARRIETTAAGLENTGPAGLHAEVRALQRSLDKMRDTLEQQTVANTQTEIAQLRQSISALRDRLDALGS